MGHRSHLNQKHHFIGTSVTEFAHVPARRRSISKCRARTINHAMGGCVLDVHAFKAVTQTSVSNRERSLIIVVISSFNRFWTPLVPMIDRLREETLPSCSDAPRFRPIL